MNLGYQYEHAPSRNSRRLNQALSFFVLAELRWRTGLILCVTDISKQGIENVVNEAFGYERGSLTDLRRLALGKVRFYPELKSLVVLFNGTNDDCP